MRHVTVLLLGAVGLVPLGAAADSPSPDAQLRAARAVMRAQQSVHYTDTSVDHLGTRYDINGDVGAARGIQRISFVQDGKHGQVTIVVVGKTAYVRGNAFALNKNLGFREQPSAKYAGTWISIPSTDRYFSWVADNVTLGTLAATIDLLPLFREHEATVAGRRAIVIEGRPVHGDGGEAISLRASGDPLPIERRIKGDEFKATIRYSNWNEELHVHVPPHAVPVSRTGLE